MAAMLLRRLLLLATATTRAIHWNPGCLCDLKDSPVAHEFSMPSIFGTPLFRQHGKVARFCPCSVETVQQLNREIVAPRLLPLLNRTFFRYAKIELERACPFWDDSDGACRLRDCAVETCSEDEERRLATCSEQGSLGEVVAPSLETLGAAAPAWDLAASSWTNDDDILQDGGDWIDLVDNPEQYTGYSGPSGAWRVWHELHAHNVFHSPNCCGLEEAPDDVAAMPVEERLFYRAFSGLHASISSHIAANYLLDRKSSAWGLELDEYERRIGAHPERLHNLHFVYLLVLRALELASPTLANSFSYGTGMPREDASAARAVRELLSTQPEWPLAFDEHAAFAGVRCPSGLIDGGVAANGTCSGDASAELEARTAMLAAYRSRLHNVSRLMDCVGCGRCRLWGKLQVQGLGTALRILYAYAPDRAAVVASLGRAHVVALFNLLGRLSHSVEVARVAVPLLGGAHSTCSPRGCAASEYAVDDADDDDAPPPPPPSLDLFGGLGMSSA